MRRKIFDLAEKVAWKTKQGQAFWKKTGNDQFTLNFKNGGAVAIEMRGANLNGSVEFSVNSPKGNTIDSTNMPLNNAEEGELVQILEDLYDVAKTAYLDNHPIYKSMFEELDNTEMIGKILKESPEPKIANKTSEQF